jgi:UDP-galactopyranose mutase
MGIDIICMSHLRWNFVFQRPQHIMSRFRKQQRVFFIEEPIFDAPSRYNEVSQDPETNVWVVTPHLPVGSQGDVEAQRALMNLFISSLRIKNFILWYYSPMYLPFTDHLKADLVVYDCMDELSAFKFAPPELRQYEKLLMQKADVVFTGGHHLYEAKKDQHANIHPFPSSIDKAHFSQARTMSEEPADQAGIPHPRIGFYGVVDERFNITLVSELATARPDWHFVIIGPVVKIDPDTLPRQGNIHYIGQRNYKDLPAYLSGWDVAFMPFALNESTKYISPTKTPEYLAGGRPVVSTSIRDVVVPYGEQNLVCIADTTEEFKKAIEHLVEFGRNEGWLARVDKFLSGNSWDHTCHLMSKLMTDALSKKKLVTDNKNEKAYV